MANNSRQNRWKRARIETGRCPACGRAVAVKKNGDPARECEFHLIYNRERMRRKLKLKKRYRGAASYTLEKTRNQKKPRTW